MAAAASPTIGVRSAFSRRLFAFVGQNVLPDDRAEVERDRQLLRGLQRVLDWHHNERPGTDELAGMPERMRIGLRETASYR